VLEPSTLGGPRFRFEFGSQESGNDSRPASLGDLAPRLTKAEEPWVSAPPAKRARMHPIAPDDQILVEALRRGDEAAFVALLDRYGAALVRFANVYTTDSAGAEDAMQETWLGVLRGIHSFEGRSSLKTWIFRILVNRLRSRCQREGRLVPFSALFDADTAPAEPAVDPDRFLAADHPRWPGHWSLKPQSWGESPEERLLSAELHGVIERAVATLPPAQREVITLRDIEGWRAEEVCNVLELSESNQRVLLHRARSKIRHTVEDYMRAE
jgi:RNA polymerase sigma-70 factor (ECF subfamily)